MTLGTSFREIGGRVYYSMHWYVINFIGLRENLKSNMAWVCKSMLKYAIDIGGLRESLKRNFRVAINHSNAIN